MDRKIKITNVAEANFARSVDRQGKLWFWQPKRFRLPPPQYSYTPDFYVVEDACFYEIAGSRQAYSYRRAQIDVFRRTYPALRLEVVNAGAWKDGPRGPQKDTVKTPHKKRPIGAALNLLMIRPPQTSVAAELLSMIRANNCRTMTEAAILFGTGIADLSLVLHGHVKGLLLLKRARENERIRADAAVAGMKDVSP